MKARLGAVAIASLALAGGWVGAAPERPWMPREGRGLLGTPAPDWRGIEWIQGGPLRLADLRGKVVLLRFWLMDCPYCRASAPALRSWSERHRVRGLVVVGLHHPKSEAARDRGRVAAAARALGFDFPIGTDDGWATIRAYGVGSVFKRYTSVTFLIDRAGIIRFVHDGGEYHEDDGAPGGPAGGGRGGAVDHAECAAAYRALDAAIRGVLAEGEGAPQGPEPGGRGADRRSRLLPRGVFRARGRRTWPAST